MSKDGMYDVHSRETRSKNMSAIRSTGNKSTELKLIKLFKDNVIIGWRRHLKNVYGKPDFTFHKQKIVIFIDGCFWHQCPLHYRVPKSNQDFWLKKIATNTKRDERVNSVLTLNGWKVIRIWEHDLKSESAAETIQQIKKSLSKG